MNTLIVILQVSIAEVLPQLVAAFCAALIVTAASWGIGRIGTTALDSIARQPEAAGDIRSSMVVSAALIEGVSFFAIIICALVIFLS